MRWSIALTCLTMTGCFGEAELDGLPCPCARGWTCCESERVCVRDAATCPSSPGGNDAGTTPATLAVSPESAALRLGATLGFEASVPVTWSVVEPSGGSVDASGNYTAPLRPGVYHLEARSERGETVEVPVEVGPQRLDVAAGRPGGAGHADGFGSDVRFRSPKRLVGNDTHLYVNDTYSVRRIALNTGEVTTLARDVSVDQLALSSSGLYLTQPTGQKVQRADLSTGALSAVAGGSVVNPWTDWHDGTGEQAGIFQVAAMVAVGDLIYINDSGLLRRLDPQTGQVTTIAVSQFWKDNGPPSVNFAGVPAGPWDKLGAMATRDGQVYLTEPETLDKELPGIWKYDPGSNSFEQVLSSTLSTAGPFPAGGDYFWSLSFDEEGAPLAAIGNALVRPVALFSDIALYPVVGKQTEAGDADGTGGQARLSGPLGVWGEYGSGVRYVADNGNRKIRTVQLPPVGSLKTDPWIVSTLAGESAHAGIANGKGTNALLSAPHRLAVDDDGAVLAAELTVSQSYYIDQLRRIDSEGNTSIVAALPKDFSYVLGMTYAQGTLFVSATSGGGKYELMRRDAQTGAWISMTCDQPAERWFSALSHDGQGWLYVVDGKSGTVERVDVASAAAACAPGKPGLQFETVMTGLGPHPAVQTTTGIFKTFVELSAGESGRLFVAAEDSILELTLATGATRELAAPDGGWGPVEGLAYDPAGVLFVLPAGKWDVPIGYEGQDDHRIQAVVVETGELYELAGQAEHEGVLLGGLPGGVNNPSAIALLSDGALAIADEDENVVLIAR